MHGRLGWEWAGLGWAGLGWEWAGLGWAGSGLSSAHFHDLYLPVPVARSAVWLACNSRPTALLSFLCRHGHYSYSSMLACSISDVECYKMWARLPLNHVIVGFSELGGASSATPIFGRKKWSINGKLLTWIWALFAVECHKMVLEHFYTLFEWSCKVALMLKLSGTI